MKKLLATVLALGTLTFLAPLSGQQIEANAKAYDMKPSFAQAIKNGTLPSAKGYIGISYKGLKSKTTGKFFTGDPDGGFKTKDGDIYVFSKYSYKPLDFASNSKAKLIMREYNYQISQKSIEKYFGKSLRGISYLEDKSYKAYVYKAGKHYVYARGYKNHSEIWVGNKNSIAAFLAYDEIW